MTPFIEEAFVSTSSVAAPSVTPDAIFQLATGYMASKMLFAAGDIDLFAHLAGGPLSGEALAASLQLPQRSVQIVADAMVALGLLTLDEGPAFAEASAGRRYRNTDVAQTFLAGKTPADMRPLLRFWDRLSYPAWQGLASAVRSGGQKTAALFSLSEEESAIFSAGVEAATAGGAMALAGSYDFAPHKRVLDIGGGTGSFLKFVQRRHPRITGTLLEMPTTAAYARSRFTPAEAESIAVVEGDILEDAMPPGHDAMILAHILHGFDEAQNAGLLRRASAAAPAGGRLLIVDFFLDPTRTSPVMPALMSGEFLVQTMGRSYSAAEVSGWLNETGWRYLEHRPLAGAVSLVIAETS
jgi:SAM-dependent methyltransferase